MTLPQAVADQVDAGAAPIGRRRLAERQVAERLLTEPTGASPGLVLRTVLGCAGELDRAGVNDGLEDALLAMARVRLTGLRRTG